MKPSNTRTYRVRTLSGSWGWRSRLRAQYRNYTEFAPNSAAYGLARRLGYPSAAAAWNANPVIEGGVNPSDYRKVGT